MIHESLFLSGYKLKRGGELEYNKNILNIHYIRDEKRRSLYEKTDKNSAGRSGNGKPCGGVASAETISGAVTVDNDKLTDSEYRGSGEKSSLTVNMNDGTRGQAIVTVNGKSASKTFSDMDFFTIAENDKIKPNTLEGIVEAYYGASISFENVKTINLGSDDKAIANGPVIHAFSGTVKIDGADSLNIYGKYNAVQAQQSGDNDAGLVDIKAKDVNIHAGSTAVISAAYGSAAEEKVTKVNINADNVNIESNGNGSGAAAVMITDKWGDTVSNGNADLSIHAANNVTINGVGNDKKKGYGVAVTRNSDSGGTSNIQIVSDTGDVKISGTDTGVYMKGNGDETKISGTISGKNVDISSDGTGISLDHVSNEGGLSVTGDTIHISSGTEDAINMQKGSQLTLSGRNGDNSDVTIDGYVTVQNGAELTFAKDTTTHVDSKYLTGEKSFITTGGTGTVTFGEDAKLDIGNVGADTTLKLIDNEKQLSGFNTDMITTDNVLQKFTIDPESGAIKVETVDSDKAAELLGGSLLTNVALAATGDAKYADVKALVDGDNAKEALDSAAGLAAMANVAHGTYTMNGIFSDAVSGHLMNRQDQDVWAYGFHSKENVNGLSFGADYDAQYNGIAAGADFYKKGGTTAGLALIYADSNVSGSNGFATTKNDADYYGVSLYSRFDRGSYALLGDISYMKGDHDVTQMNKGQIITASPDSDSISVGVKAVKDYAAGENGTLTPYVGLRYLRLSTDDFTASNGLRYEGDDQDLVIVPVGVNYTASISHGKWSVRPYAGIGYVWTAGDRSADQTVMLGTAADSFSYDTADSGSFIARAGVTTDCGDMSYGIGYSWQKGDSVSNNAWTLSASYHF